jgi:hypothetical protein
VVPGIFGETYFSCMTNFLQLAVGPTHKAFTWISRVFTGESPSQKKKFYFARLKQSGTAATVYTSIDDADMAQIVVDPIPSTNRVGKAIQFKIVGTATTVVRSFSVALRNMVGAR